LKESSGFLWYRGQRPVVIFPEGTKTNGCGILNIEPDIIKMID
jgi:1-acyl-sn-glycerol-3-phosphate acyltransferase